jgi:hypothetical protein
MYHLYVYKTEFFNCSYMTVFQKLFRPQLTIKSIHGIKFHVVYKIIHVIIPSREIAEMSLSKTEVFSNYIFF